MLSTGGTLILAPPRYATSYLVGLRYLTERDTTFRLRAAANTGERLTEFGEKPVDERLELRLRWHF